MNEAEREVWSAGVTVCCLCSWLSSPCVFPSTGQSHGPKGHRDCGHLCARGHSSLHPPEEQLLAAHSCCSQSVLLSHLSCGIVHPPALSSPQVIHSSSSCCCSVLVQVHFSRQSPCALSFQESIPLPFPRPGVKPVPGFVCQSPVLGVVWEVSDPSPLPLWCFSLPSWSRAAMRELGLWRGRSRCTPCRNSWNLARRR